MIRGGSQQSTGPLVPNSGSRQSPTGIPQDDLPLSGQPPNRRGWPLTRPGAGSAGTGASAADRKGATWSNVGKRELDRRGGGVKGDVGKLLAVTKTTESAVASFGLSPVAVQPLMVFAGQRGNSTLGRIRILGEHEVGPVPLSERHRHRSAVIRAIADRLERVFPAYEGSSVDAAARSGTNAAATPQQPVAPAAASDGLFDADGLR